jgi:hypothetical protein
MMRRTLFTTLIACLALLALPSASQAAYSVDCDLANPNVNLWNSTPGNWSDGSHWSQGTAPDANDLVCAQGPIVVDVPTIDAAQLLVSHVDIPPGTTVTSPHAYFDNSHIAGTLVVTGGAPSTIGLASTDLTGTLRTVGPVDASAMNLSSATAAAATIDVTGTLTSPNPMSFAGDLDLTGTGNLDLPNLVVAGSVHGPGTVTAASGLVDVGSRPGADVLSAPTMASLSLHGDVSVTANIEVRGAIQLDGTVTLNGVTVTSDDQDVQFIGSRTSSVMLDGGSTFSGVVAIYNQYGDLVLQDCTLPSTLNQVSTSGGDVVVSDADCLDPVAGTERILTANGQGLGLRFAATSTLDAGGTLKLGIDSLSLDGGTSLTDGATTIDTLANSPGIQRIGLHGSGWATIVGLDLTDGSYTIIEAGTDQHLVLDRPLGGNGMIATMHFISTAGGGTVEIHDPAPRTNGWSSGDGASTGSGPVRYQAGGVWYEPLRNYVRLSGAAWTPDGVAHVRSIEGSGTINGSLSAGSILASAGTLGVLGALDATTAGVRHAQGASNGVLDLTAATPQHIGRFDVHGPDSPTPIPSLPSTDTRIVAPGIASTSIGIVPTRITVPSGLAYRVTSGTGTLDLVDAIAPGAVTANAISIQEGVISVGWNAATDAGTSGVAGYAVSFTRANDSDPGSSIATSGTNATSGKLAIGTWWMHIRAIDSIGNVGPIAHFGPLEVRDSVNPVVQPCAGDADCDGVPDPLDPVVDTCVGTASCNGVPGTLQPVIRTGSARADKLFGRGGADRLNGVGGNDLLYGFSGNDVLIGGAGRDVMYGGGGSDRISCGEGAGDRAFGEAGADRVSCRDRRPTRANRDVIDCGPGRDTAVVDRFDIVRHCEVVVRR